MFKSVKSLNGKKFFVFNLTLFAYNLSYIYLLAPYSEHGSGSGSTKLLNTDPILIRIHNKHCNKEMFVKISPLTVLSVLYNM